MFHNIRLPESIERGSVSSPTYSTTVNRLRSGFEQRNQNWATPLSTFDIGYSISNIDDIYTILNFFHAREGRTHSFRFKDWVDYDTGTTQQPTESIPGRPTSRRLVRRYTDGTFTKDANIDRPISDTLTVYRDGTVYTNWSCLLYTSPSPRDS